MPACTKICDCTQTAIVSVFTNKIVIVTAPQNRPGMDVEAQTLAVAAESVAIVEEHAENSTATSFSTGLTLLENRLEKCIGQ